MVCDAKENVRKLADVRVRLEKDGSKGKGYWMFLEKTQGWMSMQTADGKPFSDEKKIEKDGVMTELMVRGVLT